MVGDERLDVGGELGLRGRGAFARGHAALPTKPTLTGSFIICPLIAQTNSFGTLGSPVAFGSAVGPPPLLDSARESAFASLSARLCCWEDGSGSSRSIRMNV